MPPSEFVQGLCDLFQRKVVSRSRCREGETEEASGLVEGAGLADRQAARDMPPERVGVAPYGRTCLRQQEPAAVPAYQGQLLGRLTEPQNRVSLRLAIGGADPVGHRWDHGGQGLHIVRLEIPSRRERQPLDTHLIEEPQQWTERSCLLRWRNLRPVLSQRHQTRHEIVTDWGVMQPVEEFRQPRIEPAAV